MEHSFDWFTADEDEEVLWSGEPKMNSIIPAVAIGIPLIPVGIGLIIILAAYLNLKNTDFVISTEGLYKKTGILSRRVQKIGFGKIQDTSFNQGVFGKYFDYGNVDISTAGGERVEMRFNAVENPREIQETVNKRIKTDRNLEKPETDTDQKILEELSRMREQLEQINEKL